MDEAWNNKEDQKFALWFLFVPDFIVGYLYDDVVSFYDRAKDISKNIKTIKIKEFIEKRDFESLNNILKSQNSFELKFKNINFTNKDIYKGLIDKLCWSYPLIRYCAFIIDKKYQDKNFSYRDMYIQNAAMCIANNMHDDHEYIFISDSITQPKTEKQKGKQFENYLKSAVEDRLKKKWNRSDNLIGVLRVESHASVLLQLTDTILWSVTYFMRKQQGLISSKSIENKWLFAETLRKKFWDIDFLKSQTVNKRFYLSIRHYYKKS